MSINDLVELRNLKKQHVLLKDLQQFVQEHLLSDTNFNKFDADISQIGELSYLAIGLNNKRVNSMKYQSNNRKQRTRIVKVKRIENFDKSNLFFHNNNTTIQNIT